MSSPPTRQLNGRALAMLFGALGATAIAFLLGSYGLALVAVAVGLTVALGARAPSSLALTATFATDRTDPREGEAVTLEVQSALERGRSLLEWRARVPAMGQVQGTSSGIAIATRKGRTTRLSIAFPLFGLQRLGPLDARIGDVFGFAATTGVVGRPAEIRVYPRAAVEDDLTARSKQLRPVLGAYEVSQPGDGFEFFTLRDYHPGDRPRDVNWKASGRVGRLIVNQHQRENHAIVTILLDVRGATRVGARPDSPFAQGCRAAIAIATAHLRARDDVRVIAYGKTIAQDRHTGETRHLQGILDLIVGLEPAGNVPLRVVVDEQLPRLGRRSPVVLISPLADDPSIVEAVTMLRGRDAMVSAFVPGAPKDVVEDVNMERWRKERMENEAALRALGVHIHEDLAGLLEADRRGQLEVSVR